MDIKKIKDRSDYEKALEMLSQLMDQDILPGSEEESFFELLLVVIKEYEQRVSIPSELDPIAAIKFRMDQSDLSPKDLVPFLGSLSKVSEVLSGKRRLSLPMIRRLHSGLGIPLKSLVDSKAPQHFIQTPKIDYTLFPLKEMRERGCFGEHRQTLTEIKEYAEEHIRAFCEPYDEMLEQNLALLRAPLHQRGNKKMNKYSLLVWQICVLKQSEKMSNLPPYDKNLVNESWLRELAKLSVYDDGYKLIRNHLKSVGIAFVIEPPFKKTYLDGAAMIYKGRPIIALTLRYKRLDNFWFVLAHELAHLIKHLGKSRSEVEIFIDDLKEKATINSIEAEADAVANEALIPQSEWDEFKNRQNPSPEEIEVFAQKIHVNPALVAGRIRHERQNYRIYSQLINGKDISLPL